MRIYNRVTVGSWSPIQVGIALVRILLILGPGIAVADANADANAQRLADTDTPALDDTVPLPLLLGHSRHLSISLDNDVFAPHNEDRDYTGGFGLVLAGLDPDEVPFPFARIGRVLRRGADPDDMDVGGGVITAGIGAFTPDDIRSSDLIFGERPYASLAYAGTSVSTLSPGQRLLSQSTFIVGLLAAPIAERLQRAIHRRIGAPEPMGYRYQISDGGELTARYAVARHILGRASNNGRTQFDVRYSITGSVGFLTEVTAGMGFRWGRIASPWWSSVSEYADYHPQPSPPPAATWSPGISEVYLFGGIRSRVRVYNALLQGQFVKSSVTFDFTDVRRALNEAWVGVSMRAGRVGVSYALRYQSAEIRQGPAARNVMWASISVSRFIGK